MTIVCGVDCSTQATKVLLCDADSGEVVASGSAAHEVTGSGGASETDPDVWWRALCEALAETGRASEAASISVAAQQHGLIVCDEGRRPLRPAVLWNDTRSAPDADRLVEELGADRWAEEVGSVPVASFTVTTWAWLVRTEPDTAKATTAVRLPHDWLTERLSGRGATDRGDASGTGWWSTRDETYRPEILDRVGLDPGMLPEVLGPGEPAGRVTPEAAEALGLPVGIPVGPGTGDNMGAALGLGVRPGEPVMSLGTSGTVYVVSEERACDPAGVAAGFADATGRYLPLACTLNCTLAVDRMARWLGIDRETTEPGGEVVAVPFFTGERTPNLPGATGAVAGLRDDTTPGQILLGTYEGAVVSLLDALERLPAGPEAPMVLVGGGARGSVWRDTVLRLSGRAVELPDLPEAVAYGAAVQAAAVLRGEPPEDVGRRWAEGRTPERLEAVDRDTETLERHRVARERLFS